MCCGLSSFCEVGYPTPLNARTRSRSTWFRVPAIVRGQKPMLLLDSDYLLMEQIGTVLDVVALVLIAAGEFVRHAVPRIKAVGQIGEVVGWIAWAALSIVATQRAAERSVDCSLYSQDCPTSLPSELWRTFGPYLVDGLIAAAAAAVGWVLAKAWTTSIRRRPGLPPSPPSR